MTRTGEFVPWLHTRVSDLALDGESVQLLSTAVDALANSLSDESPHVGLNAAYTLECLGSAAQPHSHSSGKRQC